MIEKRNLNQNGINIVHFVEWNQKHGFQKIIWNVEMIIVELEDSKVEFEQLNIQFSNLE